MDSNHRFTLGPLAGVEPAVSQSLTWVDYRFPISGANLDQVGPSIQSVRQPESNRDLPIHMWVGSTISLWAVTPHGVEPLSGTFQSPRAFRQLVGSVRDSNQVFPL